MTIGDSVKLAVNSNVGVKGRWLYRVDGSNIQKPDCVGVTREWFTGVVSQLSMLLFCWELKLKVVIRATSHGSMRRPYLSLVVLFPVCIGLDSWIQSGRMSFCLDIISKYCHIFGVRSLLLHTEMHVHLILHVSQQQNTWIMLWTHCLKLQCIVIMYALLCYPSSQRKILQKL